VIAKELEGSLAAAITEAHGRWPGLPELPDAFREVVFARVDGEADLAAAVGALALPDLYLVTAVLAGDRAALAAFERLVRDETTRAVAKLGANAASPEDVIQELLLKLLVPQADKPAKVTVRCTRGSASPPSAPRSASCARSRSSASKTKRSPRSPTTPTTKRSRS
jgi:hypothetical protein